MTFLVVASFAWVSLGGACRVRSPQGRPETRCVEDCQRRASAHCSEDECIRGCRFVLDRLVEGEGERVVACVAGGQPRGEFPAPDAGAKGSCGDPVWASCAVHLGAHEDGGPPVPAPLYDEDDE